MLTLLRRLTIRRRFIATTLVVGGLTTALLGITHVARDNSTRKLDQAVSSQIAAATQVEGLHIHLEKLGRHEVGMMLNANNTVEVERIQAQWAKELRALGQGFEALALGHDVVTVTAVESAKALAALKGYTAIVTPIAEQLVAATIDASAAHAYAAKAEPHTSAIGTALGSLLTHRRMQLDVTRNEARARDRFLAVLGVGCGALIMLVLGGVMWQTYRSVQEPIDAAKHVAQRIADGDLTVSVDVHGKDEAAAMQAALARMQKRLRDTIGEVHTSAGGVQTASIEIAAGNHNLSQRTEQAAGSLQQIASSMARITETVRQTADSARAANQLAGSASGAAERGGTAVAQVVHTMDQIRAGANKIADIIAVIDGIAFQTNILALNAAVEAARAGEQGRGFAVVASEVRSLAKRSAEAAKEIKGLIGGSVDTVAAGTKLVTDAGATMNEIVASVRRVTDMIGEITAAATEQSEDIQQVSRAIGELEQATQQNSALVEQSAAATEGLKDQAVRLTSVVAAFKVDVSAAPVAASAASAQGTEPAHVGAARAAIARAGTGAALATTAVAAWAAAPNARADKLPTLDQIAYAGAPAGKPAPRDADGDWVSF